MGQALKHNGCKNMERDLEQVDDSIVLTITLVASPMNRTDEVDVPSSSFR